jgi:signal transduction histidine kinase
MLWSAPSRRRTLRGRVSLVAVGVIAGWLIVLAIGLDITVSKRLDHQIDDTLRIRAQAASAIVEISHGELVAVHESNTDSELDSGIWVFAGRRVLATPHTAVRTAHTARALAGGSGGFASRGDRRFYVLPLHADGRRIGSVVAALETDQYEKTKQLVVIASAAVALLVLAGAYPVLRITAARALRPVEEMTTQAATWSVSSPTHRFGVDQPYAELRSLAANLDELLDRLAALMRHERQLTAELSHELRTPLTRMMTVTDLALEGSGAEQAAALGAVRENCAALNAMIGTLLAAGRSDLSTTVARTELDSVLDLFAADPPAGPSIVVARTALFVGVGSDVVVRILTPIVDNAVRYAASEVRLDARRVGSTVTVTVANDGPALPAEFAQRIFEAGFRVAPDDRDEGVGLGLTLALRLARAADGSIDVDTAARWTTFRVTLPAG